MQDVARHAGVSLKTVSRVVNQEPYVRAEVAQRVRASINTLGYRRNEAARRLARRAPVLMLGLVIENISNEFYARLAKAVERAADAHEALVVFGSYDERLERERMLVASMYGRGVDAMIIVPSAGDHRWLGEYLAGGLTAVFVDRLPAGLPRADAVLLDDRAGGRLATRHLLEHGHARIGLVSDEPRLGSVHARAEGYRTAVHAAGLTVDESLVVQGAFEPRAVQREVTRLLEAPRPPTAFLATNNRAATGVLYALRQRAGPPVALVSFDDFAHAELLQPAVTVVRYDIDRLGASAVELLLDRIKHPARPARQVVTQVELIPRGSGELPPPR